MELDTMAIQAKVLYSGSQRIELDRPANIRIHTTGEPSTTLLSVGPSQGKHWFVTISVQIEETDS